MNITFLNNKLHLTLNEEEARMLRCQLIDSIDRLFDEKKMASGLYDENDPVQMLQMQKHYQDPIDFNLMLRETISKFIEYTLYKEEVNNG